MRKSLTILAVAAVLAGGFGAYRLWSGKCSGSSGSQCPITKSAAGSTGS